MEAANHLNKRQAPPPLGPETVEADLIEFPSGEALARAQAYHAQQAALESLPHYPVHVVRRNEHKPPQTTRIGTFYQETVRYSDGAVRLVTIGIPKQACGNEPIISGDPWLTGPDGFNRREIEMLVSLGFPVVWNHHQGRHAALPTTPDRFMTMLHFLSSKSVGKSAAQEHALLDSLAQNAPFDTSKVIRKGYSRSAMSGEAFIATADQREVVWSDSEGACFPGNTDVAGLARIVLQQGRYEAKTVFGIAKSMIDHRRVRSEFELRPIDALRTFDAHILNIVHEAAWPKLLINGDTGVYARAVPLAARGIRTIYENDIMSQLIGWQEIYKHHQGIALLVEPGSHLSGASSEMMDAKAKRYEKAAQFMLEHGSLATMSAADVLPDTLDR